MLNKKLCFMAIVTVATAAIAPVANAQEANSSFNVGPSRNPVSLDVTTPANAAAAVRIDYDDNNRVDTLSAASAFGTGSALAVATQDTVFSAGSSNASGSIDTAEINEAVPSGVYVDFGLAAANDNVLEAARQGARLGVQESAWYTYRSAYDGAYRGAQNGARNTRKKDILPAS